MASDFGLFRGRLDHACRVRNLTHDRFCAGIGLGVAFKALDIYRLAQTADRLDVLIG
jgi:hypothetical protein